MGSRVQQLQVSEAEPDALHCGPHAAAGYGEDETEAMRGCHLIHTEHPRLHGHTVSSSIYLSKIGQHMKIGSHINV